MARRKRLPVAHPKYVSLYLDELAYENLEALANELGTTTSSVIRAIGLSLGNEEFRKVVMSHVAELLGAKKEDT